MTDPAAANRNRALAIQAQSYQGIPDPVNPLVSRDTAKAADISDVAKASMAEEPEAQMDFYSQQMGIRRDRFGMMDGDIVYRDDQNQIHAVAPGVARGIAKQAGPVLPMATGGLGAVGGLVVGAPTGPGAVATTLGAGAASAAAGQTAREGLANYFTGQEVSGYRIGREAATDVLATGMGLFVGKGLTKAAASKAVRRMEGYIKSAGMDTVDALKKAADDFGITLTPAELTNVGKLRGGQKALSSLPESAQIMEDFYERRGDQISDVVTDFLGDISPVGGLDEAGEALQAASQSALKGVKATRTARGSPAYQRAFESAPAADLEPMVDLIDSRLAMSGKTTRNALQTVKDEMYDTAEDGSKVLIDDLEVIQNRVKEEIDNQIGRAQRAGEGKAVSALMDVKDQLLTHLDDISPEYRAAREMWGDLSREVTSSEVGSLAPIAKAKVAKVISEGPKKLFTSGTPDQIRQAKDLILSQGGEDAWNAGLRAYMEDAFDKAGKVAMSNVSRPQAAKASQGVRWWAELKGDKRQAARLKAAMTSDQWFATNKLMGVLEATGRALDFNSDTAFKQEFIKDLRREVGTGIVGKVNIPAMLRKAEEAYGDFRFGRGVEQIAQAITSEDSLKALTDLKGLSNRSAAAFIGVMHALGFTGRAVAEEVYPPADIPIGP